LRRKFPKGTDFTTVSGDEIKDAVNWVNNIFRSTLNYKTALEVYNQYVQN
jgi:IS30 family transposase